MKPNSRWRLKLTPLSAAVAATLASRVVIPAAIMRIALPHKTRLVRAVALACLSVSMLPLKVEAVDTSWAAGTADWNTGPNWSTGNVPTNADTVHVNNGGTVQVQSADAEAANVRIGSSAGITGNLVINNGFELVSSSGAIGNIGGTGMATVTGVGSSWDVGLGNIAVGADGGNGTLNILAGASLPGGNNLRIGLGPSGTGLLTIDGAGTSVNFATMEIGLGGGATGTVNLTGNSVTILDGGVGTVTIGNGTLNIGSGGAAGILNTATVNGTTGTSILNFNHTDAGYFFTKDGTGGGGAINITGSLAVNHLGTGTTILTGNNTYTDGTTISAGTLQAGAAGAFVSGSSYTVNGGTLDLNDFDLTMSSLSGTGGTVDLGTADLTVNQSSSTSYAGGISGTGTLTKQGTGALTLTGNNTYTGDTTVSNGELVFDGGANTIGGIIVEDGDLAIQNGGSVSNNNGAIGFNIGSTGTVTVDGIGSIWTSTVNITVGLAGNGTLDIQNGGSVSNTTGRIGNFAGSTGTVTVDGTGSAWANSATLTVGDVGNGSLAIQNGGSVSNTDGFIGQFGNSTGIVTVDGTGSAWVNSSDLAVGNLGDGSLAIQNGGSVSNSNGRIGFDIGSTGTVTVDGTGSTWTNSGSLTVGYLGNGSLTIQNGGSVSAASVTLSLFGNGGALNIGSGGSAGILNTASVNGVAGTATLNFNHSDANYFFTNNGAGAGTAINITGSTAVNHVGSGTTVLTGINTYTGPTTINNGILSVNGSIASASTINAGGTLGGSGTVGNVTINGGTLAPGNSIGTLNVAGNVDFSAGGTYAVEVDAAGNADLINATGTATLTNGTVLVIPEAGNYADHTDYTILTAAGGLGGTTFNSVSSTLAFLTPTLSYNANNVFLNLVRNDVSFAAVAGTPNQVAVGTAINALSNTDPDSIQDLMDNLFILTADGANQAYDSLSGVQHTHGNIVALQSINQFKGLLFDRIQGNNQFLAHDGKLMLAQHHTDTMTDAGNQLLDGTVSPQRGWWLRGTGNFGDIDDTRNATGASYKAGGIAAGLDFDLTPDLTAGAAVGYTRTDADVANGGLDVDTYQAALYGRLTLKDDYYLTGMTGVGFHNMDSNRNVTVGLLNTSAEADYDAWTGNAAIEGGRKFTLNANTSITPFAGLEYAHINRDSFTEKDGGVTNLHVNEDTQDSLRSSLGARISHSWITQGYRITPTAELAWIHEFMEDESGIRAGFATAPTTTFSVDGPDLDRDRARLALGLNVQLSNTAHLNLGYQGEFAGSDDRHDIAATFRMVW